MVDIKKPTVKCMGCGSEQLAYPLAEVYCSSCHNGLLGDALHVISLRTQLQVLEKQNDALNAEIKGMMRIPYALYHNKIRDGSGRCGEPCGMCRIEELERELEELKRKM